MNNKPVSSPSKKPVLWRTLFTAVIVLIFALSIYPLTPPDFYKTLNGMITYKGDKETIEKDKALIDNVIKLAKEKQVADKSIYPSIALDLALIEKGVDLTHFIKGKNVNNNKDVISMVRKNASSSIRLGLDLNGGAEFLLELIPDKEVDADGKSKAETAEKNFDRYRDIAIEILRNRLEGQNIYETEISPAGSKFISLRVPIVSKDEKVKLENIIKMSAKLQFKLVHKENSRLVAEHMSNPNMPSPPGYQIMESIDMDKNKKPVKSFYFVSMRPEMDGKNIKEAFSTTDQLGRREIILEFNSKGAKRFGEVTRENVGRLLAIVLDGKLYCAPSINTAIEGGNAVITGQFSKEEADTISNALVSGSLPVRIEVNGVFDTDPTLGAQCVENSIYAGVIATILIMLFMGIYYMKAGLIANIALLINIILMLGALAAFEATLTLPGIAGLILTIGMAVDGNILIYERIREELNKGKSILTAVEYAYQRVFLTIVDSHVTTLIIAVVLMCMGSGAVKGFGVALTIGIAANLFTSLFVTHLLFDLMGRFTKLTSLKMLHIMHYSQIPFLKYKYYAFAFSGILLMITLGVVCVRGTGILGVDFTGGNQITFEYKDRIPEESIQKVLQESGIHNAKVSYKTSSAVKDNRKMEIFFSEKDVKFASKNKVFNLKELIGSTLNQKFPKLELKGGQETFIGGLVGWEFTKTAIYAVILSLLAILVYMSLRFEISYAVAGIISLFHDSIIALGMLFLIGGELSMPVVAAVLTLIGYSINDTIVVYDRIRENLGLIKNKSYNEIIDLSINQTLLRTILTSLTVVIVLLVLYFMGGIALHDFVFVMLIGVIKGTYSSIFIASPLVSIWHKVRKTVPEGAVVRSEQVEELDHTEKAQ